MPDWKEEIAERLRSLRLPPAREAEIAEELAQHVEDPTLPIDDVRTGTKIIDQALWAAKIGVALCRGRSTGSARTTR
jgi:hypothetical protein